MSTTVLPAPRITAAGPGFWQRLWQALEANGQRRAAGELRRAAWRLQSSDPVIARQLLEAADHADSAERA